jgi:hypothetical protein
VFLGKAAGGLQLRGSEQAAAGQSKRSQKGTPIPSKLQIHE